MMSAVCLYVSCYYFIMYSMRRHERKYLTFAMSCFSAFIYDLTCAGLYNSINISEGMFWQKGNFISTSLVSVSILWFISDFTAARIGRRAAALTMYFLIMIPVILLVNNELVLTPASPSIKHIKIGSLPDLTYYEGRPGFLCTLLLLVVIITFLYLIRMLIRYSGLNPDRKAAKIIISFCIFFAGVSNDIFVAYGYYNFIYISEYAFMYIIIIMGYELQVHFVRIQKEVESLNVNLELKVNERTIELIENQKRIEEEKNVMAEWRKDMDFEMNMARSIQQQIIPDNNPASYISAMFKPMAPLGGDFYDFIRFRETDTIGIFISDVSGHGIPAALITTMIKSLISGAGGSKLNPAQLLMNLNETLVKQSGDNFVTAFYGIYNTTDRTFIYSCAGHNPPFLIHNNGITAMDKAKNMPLGIMTRDELESVNKAYINQTEILPANSKLLLYTDGLTDACPRGTEGHFFEDIISEILPGLTGLTSSDFVTALYQELVNFRGSESFDDDVCIICVSIE